MGVMCSFLAAMFHVIGIPLAGGCKSIVSSCWCPINSVVVSIAVSLASLKEFEGLENIWGKNVRFPESLGKATVSLSECRCISTPTDDTHTWKVIIYTSRKSLKGASSKLTFPEAGKRHVQKQVTDEHLKKVQNPYDSFYITWKRSGHI